MTGGNVVPEIALTTDQNEQSLVQFNSCADKYYFVEAEFACLLDCPQFLVKNASSGICVRPGNCQLQCEICSNVDVCLQCSVGSGTFLREGECVDKCGLGYYQNIWTRQCLQCVSGCSICNGPTDAECADQYITDGTGSNTSINSVTGGNVLPEIALTSDQYNQSLVQGNPCADSCKDCVGTEGAFLQCTSCKANRELKKVPGKVYGSCDCPKGYTEVLTDQCQQDQKSDQLAQYVNMTRYFGAIASAFTLVSANSPMMAIAMADTGQTISYLQYVNRKNAVGMDGATQSFYQSHPSALVQNPASSWFSQTSSAGANARLRAAASTNISQTNGTTSTLSTDLPSINPKIYKNGYTPYFFVNAFVLILYNVIAWLLSFVFRQLRGVLTTRLGRFLVKIFHHNLVVVVFFLTASEMTLMAFIQFQQMAWHTPLEVVSSVLAIVTVVYYVGFFLYMIYIVVENSVYSNKEYEDRLAILIAPFKNKNISQRLLPALYLLRKFITSLVLVFLYQQPELQGLFLAITYFIFWVYIFLKNPIKDKIFKIFFTVLESEMCLLHILYFFVIACGMDGDTASEVSLTRYLIQLIMVQMITYAVFSVIYLVNFIRELLTNAKKRRRRLQVAPDHSSLFTFKKGGPAAAKSEFSIHHAKDQQDAALDDSSNVTPTRKRLVADGSSEEPPFFNTESLHSIITE